MTLVFGPIADSFLAAGAPCLLRAFVPTQRLAQICFCAFVLSGLRVTLHRTGRQFRPGYWLSLVVNWGSRGSQGS
jgi:hypothetical protein